jgi:hypothetical protein
MDYGIVFCLAVVCLTFLWRNRQGLEPSSPSQEVVVQEWRDPFADRTLVLTWICVMVLCSYAPVSYQNRFLLGLQPALAVYAALGWLVVADRVAGALTRRGLSWDRAAAYARRGVSYVVFPIAAGTIGVVFVSVLIAAAADVPSSQYRVDRDTYRLGEWLATHTGETDVVLGSPMTANVFAGLLAGRVVAGHPVEVDYDRKVATIEALYRGERSEADDRAFLAANRVSYLVVGAGERALGSSDPGVRLNLSPVVRFGDAVAHEVPREWAQERIRPVDVSPFGR